MKTKSIKLPQSHPSLVVSVFLAVAACLALCAPSVHAGTTSITFGFQKGNLTTNTVAYGSGSGYSGVLDGRVTDNTGTSPLSTGLTATIGNQFQTGSPNGQQHSGLFSYDLTELNSFIAANTGPNSSVSIQSVSFQVISTGPSGTAMTLGLYGTDPFTSSGCTWSNYTTGVQWTAPYQNIAAPNNTVAYGYTGGPSALTLGLGGSSPSTTVAAGNTLTWTSSSNFVATVTNALARADKTLYLTARGTFFNNGDNRLNVITSVTNNVAFRPLLQIAVNVTTVSKWTGGSDTSWTTPGNWLSGTIPATDDLIIFDNNSTANLSTVLNQNFSVASISVANPSGPVAIGGANSLTNGAGGIDLSAATQDLTISAPVVMGTNQSWNVGASRTLNIGGAVSGSGNLTIAGAGKVSLSAANVLPNGASAGSLTVNGALDLNGTAQTINTLSGSGVVDNTAGGAATLTLTNGSFSGTIQNTGGALALVKNNSGGVTLSGTNTYSGGTTLNGGTLTPGNTNAIGTGTLTVNGGSIFYPVASMGFANAVTLNGGALEIGGANGNVTRYWGLVTLTADSAIKADGGTFGTSVIGGLAMGSGGYTLSSFNNNSGNGNTISGQITGSSGTIMNTGPGTLWITGSNTFAGTFRSTNSGSLSFQNVHALQNATLDMNAADIGAVGFTTDVIIGALTGSRDLNLGTRAISIGNNNANTIYSGAMTNNGSLTKIGNGTLILNGSNTFTGRTTVSTGTLSGTGAISGPLTVAASGTLAPGNPTGNLTINNNFTNNGTVFMALDASSLTANQVIGVVDASYAGNLVVSNRSGTSLAAGQVYQLFTAAGTKSGNFASITVLGTGASGLTGTFNSANGQLTLASAVVSQPAINQVTVVGGNFILQGTNGTPSTSYSIITTTNLTTPVIWTTNTTGVFGAGGTFSNGIPIGSDPSRFFQIKTP